MFVIAHSFIEQFFFVVVENSFYYLNILVTFIYLFAYFCTPGPKCGGQEDIL